MGYRVRHSLRAGKGDAKATVHACTEFRARTVHLKVPNTATRQLHASPKHPRIEQTIKQTEKINGNLHDVPPLIQRDLAQLYTSPRLKPHTSTDKGLSSPFRLLGGTFRSFPVVLQVCCGFLKGVTP